MPDALIIVSHLAGEGATAASPAFALKQAIEQESPQISVKISTTAALKTIGVNESNESLRKIWQTGWICLLTLDLPAWLHLPLSTAQLYQSCFNVQELRQQVSAWGYSTGEGNFWLPIALTAKGPLYAEVIGSDLAHSYIQPIHLADAVRQPLYALGYRLLRSLTAPPATYLMQFGLAGEQLWFDRLFPFPAEPAIASLHIQQPDLFACHWRCLTGQPLHDLKTKPNALVS